MPLNDNNIFEELKKHNTYDSIFPERKLGLVILWLYDRIDNHKPENVFFDESLIKKGFKEIFGHKNTVNEDYTDYIVLLREYFLKYDEDEQQYTFKAHAYEFCKMAHKLIDGRFKPTQIIVVYRLCKEALLKYQKDETLDLNDWFDSIFEEFKFKLTEQIDILDSQIELSIQELGKAKLSDDSLLRMLKKFNGKMQEVQSNFEELNKAYGETISIRKILRELRSKKQGKDITEKIKETINFFDSISTHLKITSKKLELISPKVNQLFGLLSRPQFTAKVEKFIRFLLSDSTIVREHGKKKLNLPHKIYPIPIRSHLCKFVVFEKKELVPPKERIRRLSNYDAEKVKEKFETQLFKFDQQEIIEKLLIKFDLELTLSENKEKRLSDFFFKIFDNSWTNLDLASKVSYRIFQKYSNNPKWQVQVIDDVITHEKFKNLEIWEMIIYPKH